MAEQGLKDKTVKGVIWSAVERLSVQSIFFVITIIMARILTPNDYGLIGLLAIFIEVSQALIDSGFAQALIRKQNRTEVDTCTMFYFNIVVSGILYIILWFIAPLVADFYESPLLCPVMRVVCTTVFFNSFGLVQRALLTIKLDFKTQMKSSFIAAILSGIIGVGMAYRGFGVWAIAAQQLSNHGINTVLLWFFTKWRPKLLFSWISFREMFGYGSKLVAASILNTVYNNIYQIVIGKVFTPDSLGHYTRAKQFADFPSSNLANVIQRVTFPVLCGLQNNDLKLRNAYIKVLRMIAFLLFPIMCGLAGVASPLIRLLLGDKWLFCSTLLPIICFTFMWNPIHSLSLNLLQVKGRSDLFLKLEIIKKIFGVTVLAVTIKFGLLVMCYAGIFATIVCLYVNTFYTGKLIGVGFISHFKEILKVLILSMLIYLGLLLLQLVITDNLVYLLIAVSSAIVTYVGVTKVFKFPEYDELLNILKGVKNGTNRERQ